jgi:RNA polymerase sigma-32 factor
MAARRKKTEKPEAKPVEVVDAELVEDAPRPAPKRTRTADVVVEAKPVKEGEVEDTDAAAEPAEPELGEPDVKELEAEVIDESALAPSVSRTRLAKGDPLSAYMAEVTRHPLLTREQEIELSRRYRDTGDVRAAYTLVASNLRLVVKLAHEYHRNPLSLLDLIQEGNIGLMQAVKKFDPERGVKLASYAAWWIRAYILRYIMDNWKMVKLGTTEAQRKLFFKLRQEQERLSKQGIEVTPKLLAERLNVTEQDVVEMDQRLGNDEVSIDAPLNVDDDRESRADRLLPATAPSADDSLANAELKALFKDKLADFAKNLNEKERFIFEKRLIADEPMTLQDIGTQYGVSRERARQIEAALITRMRKYMQEHIPDFNLLESEGE